MCAIVLFLHPRLTPSTGAEGLPRCLLVRGCRQPRDCRRASGGKLSNVRNSIRLLTQSTACIPQEGVLVRGPRAVAALQEQDAVMMLLVTFVHATSLSHLLWPRGRLVNASISTHALAPPLCIYRIVPHVRSVLIVGAVSHARTLSHVGAVLLARIAAVHIPFSCGTGCAQTLVAHLAVFQPAVLLSHFLFLVYLRSLFILFRFDDPREVCVVQTLPYLPCLALSQVAGRARGQTLTNR